MHGNSGGYVAVPVAQPRPGMITESLTRNPRTSQRVPGANMWPACNAWDEIVHTGNKQQCPNNVQQSQCDKTHHRRHRGVRHCAMCAKVPDNTQQYGSGPMN